jgi:hypothetical protein
MAWIKDGAYFVGDEVEGATEVPERPGLHHAWNGESWVEDVESAQAAARATISAAAEAVRMQVLTPGFGKSLAYREKANEAVDFLADPLAGSEGHGAEMYPLIYAEVDITAETAADVAAVITQRYGEFKTVEALIARTEAAAQKAVKEASTLQAIENVVATLSWPSPPQEE